MKVKPSLRSGVAVAAMMKTGAGPHHDRRQPRGGSKNEERELRDEYDDWQLDMRELDTRLSASATPPERQEEDVQDQSSA